ncbi:class I SAM-dependent methyltransferase [Chitinasiproducens palmae]|uniref:Nodulation protein S (NodS) n=1 Tax=Chitinasiproducens palmae TaxID=1770053 RepID=A0A1H2PN42_9BURK|nr:class I SAM-dependent methyltransferase [Chitinasiproducens palmae]SDV48086.1 Nodulation protein S (NodS) [Chitinasiproducens palmae]
MSRPPIPDRAQRQAHFETMFRQAADPWRYRERWYERRKRALTLAMLPRERYAYGFEPGCANGELSIGLAGRCDRLLAGDASEAATALARERLAACAHAQVLRQSVPHDWPLDARFDLVVLSELVYYLDAAERARLRECIATTLQAGGDLVACHWTGAMEAWAAPAAAVHEEFDAAFAALAGRRVAHYEDGDFLLDVWSTDGRSVAEAEGL